MPRQPGCPHYPSPGDKPLQMRKAELQIQEQTSATPDKTIYLLSDDSEKGNTVWEVQVRTQQPIIRTGERELHCGTVEDTRKGWVRGTAGTWLPQCLCPCQAFLPAGLLDQQGEQVSPLPLCSTPHMGGQHNIMVPVITVVLNPKLEHSDQGFLSSCGRQAVSGILKRGYSIADSIVDKGDSST